MESARAFSIESGSTHDTVSLDHLSLGSDLQTQPKKLLLSASTAEDWYKSGKAKINKKDYRGAIADYTKAIQLKPDYYEAYNNRGDTHSKLGNYQEAIADFNQALRIKPTDSISFYNRGNVKHKIGDKKGAIADWSQTIQLDPTHAEAYDNRGLIRLELGDRRGAFADHKIAAQLFLERGDQANYQKAIKFMQDASR